MYYAVCFCICVLIRYSMRMFFRDPRPYMEDFQVAPYKCDNSYGNPCAALLNLTAFTLILILNPTGGIQNRSKNKHSAFTLSTMNSSRSNDRSGSTNQRDGSGRTKCQNCLHYGGIFLAVFIGLNMCLAGLIDGLNSIDEILFGIGLGIWIAFMCDGAIRKPLDRHITTLMNGEY